jgi:hypothetical protein
VLNLPGVFALLTRYAPAPRVASPPPAGEKCAHPAGEKRRKDYIRTCPGPKSEAPADALSLYLSVPHTSGIGFAPSIALWHEIFCAVSARDMGTDRAAQRVMLMRMAQPALMPSPRCLDSAPAGMMQLCHRESVVQFINEVRCPWPPLPWAHPRARCVCPRCHLNPPHPTPTRPCSARRRCVRTLG